MTYKPTVFNINAYSRFNLKRLAMPGPDARDSYASLPRAAGKLFHVFAKRLRAKLDAFHHGQIRE